VKQFAVIGLGKFGASIARTLYGMGYDVLAIDKNEEVVQELSNFVTHAVQADATEEQTLKSLGIKNFDVAVVTIGSDIQASILISLLCKELGVPYVLAKAQSELHAKVLYKIGVDKVILPERDMGIRVAHNLVSSNILEYIELSPDYRLVELSALKEWNGKSLKDINMRSKYGVNVIAVKHGKDIKVSPKGDSVIHEGDILVVIGSKEDIERLEKK